MVQASPLPRCSFLVVPRVVPCLTRPQLSHACPIARYPFLVSFRGIPWMLVLSHVVPFLSRPALSLSCFVPRCPMLVSSRVVPFLFRSTLSHACPVPRCLFLVPSPVVPCLRHFVIKSELKFSSLASVVCCVYSRVLIGSLDWQSPC